MSLCCQRKRPLVLKGSNAELIIYNLTMKKPFILAGIALIALWSCDCNTTSKEQTTCICAADKDSYEIVMNIPIKVKPEHVAGYKAAFDKCRAETLKEEACKAYDLFQSYSDSTEFHLYEL